MLRAHIFKVRGISTEAARFALCIGRRSHRSTHHHVRSRYLNDPSNVFVSLKDTLDHASFCLWKIEVFFFISPCFSLKAMTLCNVTRE